MLQEILYRERNSRCQPEHVPDAALQMAAEIASQMLSVMPAVRETLVDIQSRIRSVYRDPLECTHVRLNTKDHGSR